MRAEYGSVAESEIQTNPAEQPKGQEKTKAGVLAGLAKYGVLAYEAGQPVFDVEKLKHWSSRDEIYVASKKMTQPDMVRVLASTNGLAKSETENTPAEKAIARPVMATPANVEDLLATGQNSYAERNKSALLEPWELGQKHQSWTGAFVLDSGEQVNLAEMAIATTLRKWQAERGNDGRLIVTHPVSGQRVPFSASMIHEFAGIKPQTVEDKKLLSFDGNPLKFATKYLPHLLEGGLLQRSDFRVLAGSRTAAEFNVHERRLNPKAPNVSFSNADGQYANYYVGRQKLVGTGIEIDPEHMTARLLDKQTAAIVKEEQGKKTIVATFPLLGSEELGQIQESVKRRLIERGQEPTAKNVSTNTIIGGKQMKDRVREYSITSYLKPRLGENPAEYYKRLRPLDDPEFVLGKVTSFFQEAGIGIHNLPWAEQLVLARALLEKTSEAKLTQFAKQYGLPGVRTFLSLDYDTNLGHAILELGKQKNTANTIFTTYNEFLDAAKQTAATAFTEMRQKYPGVHYSQQDIESSLMSRAKDFLSELGGELKRSKTLSVDSVNRFVAELQQTRPDEQVIRSQFKDIAYLLERKEVDLSQFESQQALVLAGLLKDPEKRAITLSTLARMGRLEPIPEIHWRVDRSMADYDRRFGIDLAGFLKEKSAQKPNQKLLEIGPGSGVSKEERARAGLANLYNELALSDKIYYPLASVVEKLIDFEALQAATGLELSAEDRSRLADFIYKCIVVAKGETSKDNFSYNPEYRKSLATDINALKTILPQIQENLRLAQAVPDQTSVRDANGNTTYPYKIQVADQSPAFQKAKNALENNITGYLRPNWQEADYHQFIQAFPANVMIGDLSDIKRLLPNQLDVELATRSTVFASGEKYTEFLSNLTDRMASQGVIIDDSIRDLDGYYYRFHELESVLSQKREPFEALVVLGPGFEGQDLRQDRVPLAMIVTKQGSSKNLAEKFKLPGFEIKPLKEVMQDTQYLQSLDKTGRTAERASQTLLAA